MSSVSKFRIVSPGRIALATAVSALAFSAPALAQETSSASGDTDPSVGLGDIVVTATRRSEPSQSIPVAITAVGADTINEAAVSNLQELTKEIVGVQYDSSGGQRTELSIRGIYTNRFDIGSNPSSGVYVDDIYQARFADLFSGLVDIERIEVLRGPQGTLFGRNTIGGAISIYTADPGDIVEGYVSGGYGNRNLVDVKGAITVPVSDKVRTRWAAGYRERDGFMRDDVSGKSDGFSHLTARGTLIADLTDTLTFKLNGSYYRGVNKAQLGNPETAPLILQGPQKDYTLDGDPWNGSYNLPGHNVIKGKQLAARLVWDADALSITAIAGWVGFGQDPRHDLDASTNETLHYVGKIRSDTYSGELRFASQDGGLLTFGDAFEWVAGIYLFQDKGREITDLEYGKDSSLANLEYNNEDRPEGLPYQAAHKIIDTTSDLTSIAFYGQGTISLTDQLGLTLGARYTRDKRDFVFSGDQISVPTFPQVVTPYILTDAPVDTSFDPKIGIEFTPRANMLFFATFSKGFKGGGIQSTPNNIAQASVITRPERVKAYEVGMKADFLNRRLRVNTSVFTNKFSDLQVRRVVTLSNGTTAALSDNAASATIKGFELETVAQITPEFRVNASYAYLDAKFDTYKPDASTDYSDNTLPRAPKNRFNISASYDIAMGGDNNLNLRAAYNYTGSFYFQPSNLNAQKEGSYGLVDASATLELGRDTSIQLWGRNLGNKTYRVYLDPLASENVGYYGNRRTYGATVTQEF